MITHSLTVLGIIFVVLMGLVLLRALMGPTLIDRLVAINVIGTKALILLLIIGAIFDRLDMFVDLSIAYAILNFISSVAVYRFCLRSCVESTEGAVKETL